LFVVRSVVVVSSDSISFFWYACEFQDSWICLGWANKILIPCCFCKSLKMSWSLLLLILSRWADRIFTSVACSKATNEILLQVFPWKSVSLRLENVSYVFCYILPPF
jgi:hypothetical protein